MSPRLLRRLIDYDDDSNEDGHHNINIQASEQGKVFNPASKIKSNPFFATSSTRQNYRTLNENSDEDLEDLDDEKDGNISWQSTLSYEDREFVELYSAEAPPTHRKHQLELIDEDDDLLMEDEIDKFAIGSSSAPQDGPSLDQDEVDEEIEQWESAQMSHGQGSFPTSMHSFSSTGFLDNTVLLVSKDRISDAPIRLRHIAIPNVDYDDEFHHINNILNSVSVHLDNLTSQSFAFNSRIQEIEQKICYLNSQDA